MNVAYAQSQTVLISNALGLRTALCNIFNILFWILIAASTIMVLVGAFFYLTAQGDAEKVTKGSKTIAYAVAGIAVALIASQAPTIIGSFFGKHYTICTAAPSNLLPDSGPQ